jgi:hypothetical protein
VYTQTVLERWGTSDAQRRKRHVWLKIATIFGLYFHYFRYYRMVITALLSASLPLTTTSFFVRSPLDFSLSFCVTMGYSAWCLHVTSLVLHISCRCNGFTEERYAFRQWVQAGLLNGCRHFASPPPSKFLFHISNTTTVEQILKKSTVKSKVLRG